MIIYKQGDILKSDADIILNGVNCVGGFGSGLAGQIAKQFPYVRERYLTKYKSGRGWKLGDIQEVYIGPGRRHIVNCATQHNYLPRNVVNADYDAIRTCLFKVKDLSIHYEATIAMPKIGCGLAKGDWNIVEKIIEEVFDNIPVTVYYLDNDKTKSKW